MTTKEEALRNVINDLKKKLKDFEEEHKYYAKKIRAHEVLIDSHRQLIEHLECTTNWSLSSLNFEWSSNPLTIDNGGKGHVCTMDDVHAKEQCKKNWLYRFLFGG